MRTVILVPYRPDDGRRDRLWSWCADRWASEHPDLEVFVGTHLGKQPFNRSLALNRAATKAGEWDVAVIADADSFAGADQIRTAVDTAATTAQMTMAFDRWCNLTTTMSDRVMGGFDGNWWPGVDVSVIDTCSSMFAIPRTLWDQVGGFDEGFAGWGSEDIAFAHAARTLADGWQRMSGVCWHFAHDPAPRTTTPSNVERANRYHAASGDKKAMTALLKELSG